MLHRIPDEIGPDLHQQNLIAVKLNGFRHRQLEEQLLLLDLPLKHLHRLADLRTEGEGFPVNGFLALLQR
ncbi:hypothetical protein D3C72_2461600 [compost metagenome]